MDQLIQQVLEIARAMWRRRWIGVLAAWVVGIAGAVGLMLIANRYEASARVYVDTKTVLRPLMRDLAVEPDIDQTVGLLARTLITRPNVELLMRKSNLETEGMAPMARDRMIESLMREIKVAGGGRDNVFNFSYRDTNPERARVVVQNLVSLFLESDTGAKRRDAEQARGFIDDQIKNYEARLAEAENRLKDFKLRNLGVADSGGKDYFARMSALTDEMGKLTVELRAAEQSRDALKRELSGETASLLPDVSSTTVAQVSEYDARLDSQRKQLDDLLRRYTELHPDVVATKRLIARLEEQRQQELEARQRAAASKPRTAPTAVNPVLQQVKLALAESEANVAALRVRASDMQSRLSQLRASASRVPQVEAELAQLNRDYDVIRRTYETMVSRREKASLSEDVDATRSAQFRVIDPPRTAPQPVFPNRMALAPLVLLAALAAGVAATFVMVQLVPTFDNSRLLRNATQRPVLGSVSMLMNDGMLRRARKELYAFGTALGGLIMIGGIWIVWVSLNVRA
ncbi:XrtA system polysaccharide chain length determinant [Piscinibacter sp. XHJ-5]|uniref:XrtA system polysaccharide chain length determinant n=1 Tax=Piscinibacter sp. XHJ-5 TaxID=3037797 RepID=UPI002452FE13|nr:XrtA system polysaccharide chain length determinant [Piscinibacter sp. XHJ-5]